MNPHEAIYLTYESAVKKAPAEKGLIIWAMARKMPDS